MEQNSGIQNGRRLKLRHALALVRKQYMDGIATDIVNEPSLSYAEIAKRWGVSEDFVKNTAAERGIGRKRLSEEDAEVIVNA